MKHVLGFLTLILQCSFALAQSTAPRNQLDYIDLVPPSPAVASLGNFNRPDIGLITGTAQFSVPLAEISLPGFTMPIALSYSSNGVKVDEVASRVGTGWQLEAGGAITRTIRGAGPDEQTVFRQPPANTSSTSREFVEYLKDIQASPGATGNPDSEPDIFSFSFAGVSGKFILDENDHAVQLTKMNITIETDFGGSIWNFKITDANGNQFYFGGGYKEQSKQKSTAQKYGGRFFNTAWFLNKVILFSGEEVTFHYSPVNYEYDMAASQTLHWSSVIQQQQQTTPNQCQCPIYPSGIDSYVSRMVINTHFLTSVVARGKKISFDYNDLTRRDCGDKLLSSITISSEPYAFQEKIVLEYDQVYSNLYGPINLPIENEIRYRPFLKAVKKIGANTAESIPLYTFDYNKAHELPTRLSFSQDHWGYYNGKANTTLLPIPNTIYQQQIFPNATANREVDEDYAVKGTLSKITYPTGGYDQIEYEANTVFAEKTIYPTTTTTFNDQVAVTNLDKDGDQTSSSFTIYFNQVVKVEFVSVKKVGESVVADDYGRVQIFKSGVGEFLNTGLQPGLHPEGNRLWKDVELPAGTYTVVTKAMGQHNTATTKITYFNGAPIEETKNWPVGGVRVKSIKSYSLAADLLKTRGFKYASMETPTISNAVMRYDVVYDKYINFDYCCNLGITSNCSYQSIFSSSLTNLFGSSGSSVSYPTVLEFQDEEGRAGVIEHKYIINNDVIGQVLLGNPMLGSTPTNSSVFYNGKEWETSYYQQKPDFSYKYVKKLTYNYKTHESLRGSFYGCIVGRQFSNICAVNNEGPVHALEVAPFEATRYIMDAVWVVPENVVEENFNTEGALPLTTTTTYEYTDWLSLQPTKITKRNSKDEQEITLNYYPAMFASIPELTVDDSVKLVTLKTKNYVSELVLQKQLKNNQYTGGYLAEFHDFTPGYLSLSNAKVFMLEGVEAKSFTILNRDNFGNILERKNDASVVESYLWDYHQLFPVAQVLGARVYEIAYTSFETSQYGGWVVSGGTSVHDTQSPTGTKHFSFQSGSLSKSLLDPDTKYIVSYWVKDGTFNVTGSTDATSHSGKNGWIHVKHTVTNVTSVSLSGSGLLDEVRLYPEGSLMKSFTYEPLVGVTSVTDQNERTEYYEYDAFGRLESVKDADGNLMVTHKYHYRSSQQ